MQITVTIQGTYSDGEDFFIEVNDIERAIAELEMVEINEDAYERHPERHDS